jgi:hypothetical protein
MRSHDLVPVLLRASLIALVLLDPLPPVPYPDIVRLFSVGLALGLLTRVYSATLVVRFVWAAAAQPGGMAVNGELLGMAGFALALTLLGPGKLSLDAKLRERLARPVLARYAPYALRISLALALLTQGLLLLASPVLLLQALGTLWLALGAAVALGLLTGWTALVAAPALLLALQFGFTRSVPLALGALALALAADAWFGLDAWLARRGGLFPSVDHEVVLARR